MTWGEIAGLIAAVAFAVLVIFVVLLLRQFTKTVGEVTKTVDEANQTIAILRKDVDGLSIEAQGLLNKSNYLLEDVNGKIAKVDPLFQAVGDIGVTVSDVNDSTRNLVLNITGTANDKVEEVKVQTVKEGANHTTASPQATTTQVSGIQKVGRTAKALNKRYQVRKAKDQSESKPF